MSAGQFQYALRRQSEIEQAMADFGRLRFDYAPSIQTVLESNR
ncbi:hypothetical protein [Acinetobacter baumannii]